MTRLAFKNMTRLAVKTYPAPTQTSRPAPMSHDSDQARTRELKRLKARVGELEEENERLREATKKAYRWLGDLSTHIEAPVERDPQYSIERPRKHVKVMRELQSALKTGGDTDA